MTGIALANQADFQLGQGPVRLTLRDRIPLNLANLRTYMFPKLHSYANMLAGGDAIELFFSTGGNGSFKTGVLGGQYREVPKKNTVLKGSLSWVRSTAASGQLDEEIDFNKELSTFFKYASLEARAEKILDILKHNAAKMETDLCNGLESEVRAVPHYTDMEASAQKKMMSLFAHNNEYVGGMFGAMTAAGAAGTGTTSATDFVAELSSLGGQWLTKQGLNPRDARFPTVGGGGATGARAYEPTVVRYTSATNTADSLNLVSKLLEAIRISQYEAPPTVYRDGNWSPVMGNDDLIMCTDNRGLSIVRAQTLAGQDLWVTASRQDPTVDFHVGKAKLMYWDILDTIELYPNSSTPTAINTFENLFAGVDKGPRIYGFRMASMLPVIHEANHYRLYQPGADMNIPDLKAMFIDLVANLACSDYRRQFVVAPSASVHTA